MITRSSPRFSGPSYYYIPILGMPQDIADFQMETDFRRFWHREVVIPVLRAMKRGNNSTSDPYHGVHVPGLEDLA